MLRLLRTALSLVVLGGVLWAAFAVDLGGRTFAEHIDTISGTPEAEQLIEGTRSTINPALQEVRDRVLGEYVEAPTWIPGEGGEMPAAEADPTVPASTLPPEPGFEPPLPGRGRRERVADPSETEPGEPPLPGRR